jgi:hypothetical protein
MRSDTRLRLLTFVLRLSGVALLAAFPAMFLPAEWMAATHQRIGLGEFPRAPVVEYLTRSIAALYGFHGVLVLLVSRDPVYYRAIVSYLAVMNIAFGAMMLVIDLRAGLPAVWTLLEGPPIASLGVVLAVLNRSVGAGDVKVTR